MKKINKLLSLALALMTCLCLAGCGDDTVDTDPANNADSTNNDISEAAPSTPDNDPEESVSDGDDTSSSSISMEPIVFSVTDITVDPTAGYGFHNSTVYGNAFSLIYSYGSVDGATIANVNILIVPMEMNDLDEILATEWCANINKEELTENDMGDGLTGWISTAEAAAALVADCEGIAYDDLYVELKTAELTAAGASADDALAQAMQLLAEAGIGDE